MPVKKRVAKSRDIDELKIAELIEGPGTCLLAGMGYYLPHNGPGAIEGDAGGFWWEITPAGQTVVLDRMQADWRRIGASIISKTEGDIWALREFGEPAGGQ